MKKYTLVFGLMVVLCCSSNVFACLHVISGSITIEDVGACKVKVTASARCDVCLHITVDCTDIICTEGDATRDGCEWTLDGTGTYEFEVTVECDEESEDITGEFEETVSTDDETIEVDRCEDTSTPVTITNNTCHTITATGFDASIFDLSSSSIDSGDTLTVDIVGNPALLSDSDMAQTVTFSSTEDGDVCILSIEDSDTPTDPTPPFPSMTTTSAGGGPLPGGGSGGCGSGECSDGSGTKSYGNMQTNIALYERDALANQAQFLSKEGTNVEAKINLGSGWISPHHRRGWSVEEYSGTDGGTVTGFTVTDASDNIYYYYELGAEIPDFPKLQRVDRKTGEGENDVERIDYEYASGKLDYQQDESGNKIDYSYNSTSGRLEKLEFIPIGQSAERTFEFTYSEDGVLENADCTSCSNARYTYVPTTQEVYDPVNDEDIPWRYYISEVKDVEDNIIEEYTYNTDDRITEHNLGSLSNSPSNKLVVSEWSYTEDQGVLQTTERKDYIDSTRYRVTIYAYDADGSLSDFIKFHQVQTDATYPSDPGDFSIISYSEDIPEKLKITEYDSGLKDVIELDSNDWLYKRYKEYSTTTLDIGEYFYTSHTNSNNESRYMLDWQENAHGGRTEYTYDDNFNTTKTLGPDITYGVTDNLPDPKDSRIVYDTLKRVKYQLHKNSNEDWVGRYYVYNDTNGKLDEVKDGVVFTVTNEGDPEWAVSDADDSSAVVTDYTYTVFGELEKTALLDGENERNIQKFYYDNKGKTIGKAKLLSDTYAISATKYTFDENNRLIIESVVKDADGSFLETDLKDDLDDVTFTADSTGKVEVDTGTLELSWIHTVYQYDAYGRKTAVIADPNYNTETRQHLKTEYTYNHQGEVTEVKSPSGRVVKTTRDGRGLVEKEETGYYTGPTFTAAITVEYTYDGDGNLKTRTAPHPDGDGTKIKTIYTYDEFGRSKGTHTAKAPSS